MSIPGSASPLFLTSAAAEAASYQIERSLRFNSADSAYLNRTPSSAGNSKTFTWSGWVKQVVTSGTAQTHILAAGSSPYFQFYFAGPTLYVETNLGYIQPSRVFRDPSAWYHFVVAVDTTQATATNRIRFYVNGEEVTDFTTDQRSSITQNTDLSINSAVEHRIGAQTAATAYSNMYLAEVHFVDGQQLAPTDFGEYDENNLWQPKEYSGTYNTNGFKLDFSDNTSTTTIAEDSSGNNNDWTANNLTANSSALQSQTWSNNFTTTGNSGNWHASFPVTNAFNGNDSNYAHGNADGSVAAAVTLSISPAIPCNSTVTFLGGVTSNGSGSIAINGGTATAFTTVGVNPTASNTASASFSGDITSIVVTKTSTGGQGLLVYGFEIDGVRLVDSGVAYTAAADTDSLIDTPTNYEASSGNNGGNYCTLNAAEAGGYATLSNGNLDQSGGSTDYSGKRGTFSMPSGKWYWEVTITGTNGFAPGPGIQATDVPNYENPVSTRRTYYNSGQKFNGSLISYGASFTTGDIIGVAFDADAGSLTFYKNGSSQGVAFSSLSDGPYSPLTADFNGSSTSHNFGQRPFAYTPPTGHLSLCTTNLPDPTIADGSTAMDVVTYSGDGTNGRDITGINHSPDLVWIKARNQTDNHILADTVRGPDTILFSQLTLAERNDSTVANSVTAFNSDGFTIGDNANAAQTNQSGFTYVGWTWDGGSSTVSNTDGSITSNVRANASAGFSIVSYTGNGTAGATIGHGLNAVPGLLIVKNRSTSVTSPAWGVKHSGLYFNSGYWLELETTDAAVVESAGSGSLFNATNPGSSVFTVGPRNTTNTSGDNYIAYCWAPVEGFSSFGSYQGNGSSDGPFVYTGHRVKWLLLKRTDSTGDWFVLDSERNLFNPTDSYLRPNLANSELDNTEFVDLLSNGFKIKATGNAYNGSGTTVIYAAYAEHPFASNARAR